MNKKNIWLIIFAFFLVLFVIFSQKISFHDTTEYITITKNLAGIENANVFSAHSLLYPAIISPILSMFPNLFIIKLINVLWLFLIGFVILKWMKNEKAFILFAFSPLVWYTSIQTSPILPASFFFLLTYIFFNKKEIKNHLFYSGLFLGLACAFYTPMLIASFLFILIYFWNKGFSDFVKYSIALFIGFIPRLILDYYLFKMPIYSLIRYIGANLIVVFGLHSLTNNAHILQNLEVLLVVILISPFLFKLFKLDLKKHAKPIIFLIIFTIIFLIRAALLKYFLIITPIIILLLSKVLNKKEIKWHCIISVFLIIAMTWNFFTISEDNLLEEDIKAIIKDFDVDYIIGGPFEALKLSIFSWENKPHFIWFQDFEASTDNKTTIREYNFDFESKLKLKDKLILSVMFKRYENKTYENYILVTKKYFEELENFEKTKCYKVLCVYEK